MKTFIPDKCHLWSKESLQADDLRFRLVESYIDTSHFGFERHLVRCADCGQTYYHEFYEVIDWDEGNDLQYKTFIPIQPNNVIIDELNKASSFELLQFFPRLQIDSKDETTIKWIR